jgi:hypothetical protein
MLAQQHHITVGTAQVAVRKKLNLFPYKVTAIQELKQTENEKRIRYCRWFQQFTANNNEDILDVTIFTDEAWFHLNGYINSQNSRIWSAHNPHCLQQTTLHRQEVGGNIKKEDHWTHIIL